MEFRFELALCAALESTDRVISRQLGAGITRPGGRIVDICLIEPGPGLDARTAITPERIPTPILESPIGPGEAIPVADAFDLPPERARALVDVGIEAGYLDRERRRGRPYIRTTARYPDDWIGSLTAIENKPRLASPGDLEAQLRYDVALGLFDEVVLATASYVTRAHLNRIPEAVGVWRFDPDTGERNVIREPTRLDPSAPGIEIRAEQPLQTDVSLVEPAAKARKRRQIAERAYGKGWRPNLPACANAQTTDDGRPYCAAYDRVMDPGRECGSACDAREAAKAPNLDRAALRASRTAWVADPGGTGPRRQSGLSRFG